VQSELKLTVNTFNDVVFVIVRNAFQASRGTVNLFHDITSPSSVLPDPPLSAYKI